MSRYGNGIDFQQAMMYDKEQIKQALKGKLVSGENENGEFVYCDASEKDCGEFILQAFDNAVYHAIDGMASGRAFEQVLLNHGLSVMDYFNEFRELYEKERERDAQGVYEYEPPRGLED